MVSEGEAKLILEIISVILINEEVIKITIAMNKTTRLNNNKDNQCNTYWVWICKKYP